MNIIQIYKAQRTGDQPVMNVSIQIEQTIPEFGSGHKMPMNAAAKLYDEQAQALFDALANSLPGGTLDRLLGKMLAYKASHFRVLSWNEEK